TADVEDEDGRVRGIVIHRMLEMLANKTEVRSDTIAAQLGLQIDASELEHYWQEARDVWQHPTLQAFFNPAHINQAFNEVPVLYQDKNSTVHGIIDRLVVTEKEALVIDYKTHRNANPDNLQNIAEAYFSQLRYYREGVQRLWPSLPVRAFLIFTACAGVVELPM
ncbi:MAG: PD-(D/E)XK nuclease family protein, partial [Thiohalomonadales bacterium]|nr:PD-(D/E)XK nuclease family protein [Thiohalomonadales bacterium]